MGVEACTMGDDRMQTVLLLGLGGWVLRYVAKEAVQQGSAEHLKQRGARSGRAEHVIASLLRYRRPLVARHERAPRCLGQGRRAAGGAARGHVRGQKGMVALFTPPPRRSPSCTSPAPQQSCGPPCLR